jgi:GxxExxY protein
VDRPTLLHADVTGVVLAAFFDVCNELGAGFLESVYKVAMIIALRARGLQVEVSPCLTVHYQGQRIGKFFPDLLVNGVVIVELKATRTISGGDKAQVLNYLKASNIEVALLLNFGAESGQFKRFLFDNPRKAARQAPVELDP